MYKIVFVLNEELINDTSFFIMFLCQNFRIIRVFRFLYKIQFFAGNFDLVDIIFDTFFDFLSTFLALIDDTFVFTKFIFNFVLFYPKTNNAKNVKFLQVN